MRISVPAPDQESCSKMHSVGELVECIKDFVV